MESVTSGCSVSAPQEASHQDELFMQQSILFSESLNELKNLRKQLHSAAEYFELFYRKEENRSMVVTTVKDYTIKALINTVDHLGSIAYKVNDCLDEKIGEVSGVELRLCCIEQRLRTCKEFIAGGGLFEQSLALSFSKHHKPGATMDVVGQSIYHSVEEELSQFINGTRETSPTIVSEEHPASYSPQSSLGNFQFSRTGSRQERRVLSPQQFPFMRSGSHIIQRSSTINFSTSKQRYPPGPRRSVSVSIPGERDREKESEQHYSKDKRLFKALLSMRKSRKDVI
ncbi:hypothetical protein FEM48_Zijuj11G0009400 [Ziziphus jujuba var. spinosa]|uniref:Protein ABIL2-like n=1 Tax=Ziziphus jujuba var. spinosa TaxID=714518 RepID=A0A978UFX4_ZIZJJ|nr:hypothetical protein FEM48_Zijuj11G0009400 [Ziziphus jujuba var. spinosa]